MKKTYLFAILIFGLLLSPFFLPSHSMAESSTYVVDTPSLTVRSGPSQEAEPIGQLREGDKIAVFGTKYGWAQSYYNGQVAYVAAHYLSSKENSTTTHTYKNITIEGEGVRIRKGPGTNFPIIAVAKNHSSYRVVSTRNNWHQVSLAGKETGWVASWLTSTKANKPEKQGSLSGYTIVLDAGHGGIDPGAIALDNSYEKNFTLAVVKKTAERLRGIGANVIVTRKDDTGVSLNRRVAASNLSAADAFISFHYNSSIYSSVNGIRTFYYGSDKNRNFAMNLQKSLVSHLRLGDRGILSADFRVLRKNEKRAALVEMGFLSNPYDLSVIKTTTHQANAANAISQGVLSYFNQQ